MEYLIQNKSARQEDDFYATHPAATVALLTRETFRPVILEPFVGAGHIAKVLIAKGHRVIGADIVDRGYPGTKILDFLSFPDNKVNVDIVTNPPYKLALPCVLKCLSILPEGNKLACYMRLQFVEGQSRAKHLFADQPFKTMYVMSNRVPCAKEGKFTKKTGSATAYAWFVWEKGFKGDPAVKWLTAEFQNAGSL